MNFTTETAESLSLGQGVYRPAPKQLLSFLQVLGTRQSMQAGTDLFSEGDHDDALFVLETGLMELSTLAPDGRRLALILLKPGTVFGEMALFDGGVRSATATAKSPSSLIRVERKDLIAEIRRNPDLSIEMLKLTIGRLRWMSAQLEAHAFQSVGARVARRLMILVQTIGEENVVRISQSELAEHAGATREAVSKTLAEWREQDIVALGRSRVTVVNPEALRAIAAHGVI